MARRYKHQSEELTNTLNTERSLWQTKFDELQQGGTKIVIDFDERKKLIDQGKQEQKVESESRVNELMAKVSIYIHNKINSINSYYIIHSFYNIFF